ncbi:Somatostatin receptor type 4 [Trichoplax sp. H2]|nr:Somatostatin receptor type 4 [Trichoplax sp. H2]|eukprot:RDD42808.1 Somatostatin receptor type 4 [Trichoplax sp. H2]
MAVNGLNQTIISNQTSENVFGRDWYVKRFMHILYCVLATTAIIGNALVCIVILTIKNGKMLKSGLNLLILSMAIMDTMTGIVMFIVPSFAIPASDYIYPTGNVTGMLFCRIIATQYIFFFFGFGSVFTITAIAIERWVAIARPYTYRKIITLKRTKIFLTGLWTINILIPLDIVFQMDFIGNEQPPCKWNNFVRERPGIYFFTILEMIRMFIPVIVIIGCYTDIAKRIIYAAPRPKIHQSFPRPFASRRSTNSINTRRKVTIMVAISALGFITCWLPNELYYTLYAFNVVKSINVDITRTTKTLIVTSSCLSPLIYTAANDDYRKGIWQFFNYCRATKLPLHSVHHVRNVIAPLNISKNVSTPPAYETEKQ